MEWIGDHTEEQKIDPDRIGIAGGSGGGWTSACLTTVCTDLDLNQNLLKNGIPNLVVLFNPLVETPSSWNADHNPALHLNGQQPPVLIMIGTADRLLDQNRKYCMKTTEMGNSCEMIEYEGATHAFFNYGKYENNYFHKTLLATDRFLARHGYLKGEPTLELENVAEFE